MRSCISIRGCVRPSVRPSIGRSVHPSVRRSHMSWISEKWAEFEQTSIRNKKVCHLKDNSKTCTRAVHQRTHLLSELCSTCFFHLQFWFLKTRPDTRHNMRLDCVVFTLENNTGHKDGWNDGRTDERTDKRTDRRTDGHDLLQRCDGAFKKWHISLMEFRRHTRSGDPLAY